MITTATPTLAVEQALTLLHPWPWAILRLGKRIENRGWYPQHMVGKRIAIHGAKRPAGLGMKNAKAMAQELAEKFNARDQLLNGKDFIIEGLICVATIGEILRESDDPWFQGPYGWKLVDVTVFGHPIPCGGAQGLWRIPERQKSLVTRALARCATA